MSRNDPAGRANRPCWFTGFVFQVARSPAIKVHRWLGLVGVHRVEVEVAQRDALLLRHRKARRRRGCSAVRELRQIVVDHAGHNAFAQIVVADVQPARVLAKLEAVASARPDEVVVDLPLRHLAALRVGLVVAAKRRERRVGTAPGQHDGKGLRAPARSCSAERGSNTSSRRG